MQCCCDSLSDINLLQLLHSPEIVDIAKELAPSFTGKTNNLGLTSNKEITPNQQKDINSAKAEIELIKKK